jgi:hypothetical protein
MSKQKYLKVRKNYLNKICDIYEFKLDYDTEEIILIYNELKKKSLKYLIWHYCELLNRI